MTLVDYVADLTRWHTHAEPVTTKIGLTNVSFRHRTKVPPLLMQLERADASGQGASRSGAGFESRPAAPLEAVGALAWIDDAAARWVRRLGEDDPGDTARCVAMVGALAAGVSDRCRWAKPKRDKETRKIVCCLFHTIENDVRRWWLHARIVTGWDERPFIPDATCPECTKRGSLRIRLEDRTGTCVECHTTWGSDDYQALAEHVRSESAAAKAARQLQPCACDWPRTVFTLTAMCPRCGSAYCVNAIRALGQRRTAS